MSTIDVSFDTAMQRDRTVSDDTQKPVQPVEKKPDDTALPEWLRDTKRASPIPRELAGDPGMQWASSGTAQGRK